MDHRKPFPMLRLPFVPLQEVFKAMDPFEIINFSIISKRAKAITKQMSFCPRYSIRLFIDETLGIEIRGTDKLGLSMYLITPDKRIDGKIVEIERVGFILRRVYKYSKDPVDEWKQLCIYVLEIFKKQTIDVLSMTMDDFVDQNVSIIDFLRTNVKSVDVCYLFQSEEENDVNEHAAYLLNNLKVNNVLNFLLDMKNGNFDGKIPKNLKELHILSSQWIGYEKLLEIDCKRVVLRDNQISNKQWNLFLKKWIAVETHSNLEYLHLDYREIEEFKTLVLHDIPHEVVDGGVKRTINGYLNSHIEINGGIDIRRVDGKTATFFVFQMEFLAMSVN
ncbi:hypothetical protein CRE_09781 [Caenorhabditis remanei]|uniref:F-box domain-containing protein n=1 Tax=Caenorhabditis remanei TaxID=31234 RepID=E3NDE3_CAERE|nr:hypothetical protein CRE_09781 [Caenorhabditis remanei]